MLVESDSSFEPTESKASGKWESSDVSEVEVPPAVDSNAKRKVGICHTAEVAACALLLLAIAVLAIVAYTAFNRKKGDYASRVEVYKELKDIERRIGEVKANVVVVERDKDGNVIADSVRDKYVIGYYYIGSQLKNFSLFYNYSNVNKVEDGWQLEDKGGLLYVCSADKKNCSAATVERAYEPAANITDAVVEIGDERYLPLSRVDGEGRVMAGEKVQAVVDSAVSSLASKHYSRQEVEDMFKLLVENIKARIQ